mgnify:CR=1 FL=1
MQSLWSDDGIALHFPDADASGASVELPGRVLRQVWELMLATPEQITEDVAALCSRVVVLDHGSVVRKLLETSLVLRLEASGADDQRLAVRRAVERQLSSADSGYRPARRS